MPRVVVAVPFADATQSYAGRTAAQISLAVAAIALHEAAQADDALAACLTAAVLILTAAVLHQRPAALVPDGDTGSFHFIPAEAARLALDPRARLLAVSRSDEFRPIPTMGMRCFTSRVQDVASTTMGAAGLDGLVARVDVVVISIGAEAAATSARPGAVSLESFHISDPGDVDRLVGERLSYLVITEQNFVS